MLYSSFIILVLFNILPIKIKLLAIKGHIFLEIVYIVAALIWLEIDPSLLINIVHKSILKLRKYIFLKLLTVHCRSVCAWER
jgi:hypothetical protein